MRELKLEASCEDSNIKEEAKFCIEQSNINSQIHKIKNLQNKFNLDYSLRVINK